MTQRLGGDVSDERRHDKLEQPGNELVRPPGPKVFRSHRPRVLHVLGRLLLEAAGQGQAQHFSESVHVEIAIPLEPLVSGQELGGQNDGRGEGIGVAHGGIGLLLPPRQAVNAEHAVQLESGHQEGQNGGGQRDPHRLEERGLREEARERGAVQVQGSQLAPHRLRLEAEGGPGGGRESGQVAERQGQGPEDEIGLAGQMQRKESANGSDDNVDAQTEGEMESDQGGPQGRLHQNGRHHLKEEEEVDDDEDKRFLSRHPLQQQQGRQEWAG